VAPPPWRESTDGAAVQLLVRHQPSTAWFVIICSAGPVGGNLLSSVIADLAGSARPSHLLGAVVGLTLVGLAAVASGVFERTLVRLDATMLTVTRAHTAKTILRLPLATIERFEGADLGWMNAKVFVCLSDGQRVPIEIPLSSQHHNQAQELATRLDALLKQRITPKTYRG
jgi:hypothetical protein